MNATEAWLNKVKNIVDDGHVCDNTLELLSSSLSFDMNDPIMRLKDRKVNYKFMLAEARYIISGMSDVRYLETRIKKFGDYSDMYPLQQGSYGPPFVEQLRYVVDTLQDRFVSRQAVMTIWRPNPRKSVDIPCTLSLQFLIRDSKLHTVVNMRSSDVFTGLIYDMFCFTVMSAVVKNFVDDQLELGTCYLNAGSSHLYIRDMHKIDFIGPDFVETVTELDLDVPYIEMLNQLDKALEVW